MPPFLRDARLGSSFTEAADRLSEFAPSSFGQVLSSVVQSPFCPRLRGEQLRRSKTTIFLGVPATRQQTHAPRILLRPRSTQTRFTKIFRELGRPCPAYATPHEVACLHQKVQLRPCLFSQPHSGVSSTLGASQFCFGWTIARAPVAVVATTLPSSPQVPVSHVSSVRPLRPILVAVG